MQLHKWLVLISLDHKLFQKDKGKNFFSPASFIINVFNYAGNNINTNAWMLL